jgi:nicotinate-nucleotide adenylyltransferase
MKIGVLGGSFDPPHLAHLNIAQFILRSKLVDKVLLVPVMNHPFRKNIIAPFEDRLRMLNILIKELKESNKIIVSRIEKSLFNSSHPNFSYCTLKALSQKHPQCHFRWIIGSDMLESFDKWHCYKEILEEFGIIIYLREGYPIKKNFENAKIINYLPVSDISSSEIRKLISQGRDVSYLTGASLFDYIKSNNLYDLK